MNYGGHLQSTVGIYIWSLNDTCIHYTLTSHKIPYGGTVISRFWRERILQGFIFTISTGKHEKGSSQLHFIFQIKVLTY